jgi:hypothetical protein
MEAACTGMYQVTRDHNPEGCNVDLHCHDNLRSYLYEQMFSYRSRDVYESAYVKCGRERGRAEDKVVLEGQNTWKDFSIGHFHF